MTLFGIVIEDKFAQPLKADSPIAIKFVDNVTDCKYEQFSKALESIFVTLFGIVIEGKLAQPLNADDPIVTKLEGNATDCKYEQFSKALESIFVTVFDMITSCKFVQFLKAFAPIETILCPPIVLGTITEDLLSIKPTISTLFILKTLILNSHSTTL